MAQTGMSTSSSGSVRLDYNAGQTFTIAPDTGYHISAVLVDGVPASAVPAYTFNSVTADHTIQARFAIMPGIPGPQ